MAGLMADLAFPLYRTMRLSRLMRARMPRLPLLAAALSMATAAGGCSFQLGSMFNDTGHLSKAEVTNSITQTASTVSIEGAESDAALRAAARQLLAGNNANTSLPWENPRTGARGTVTPIAKPYKQAGLTCHDFLASYVRGDSEAWLQGEACRMQRGTWEVRSLKPWTTS